MMAFPVEFFYFNKRMNSTAQPDTTGATYNCLLKSPSSIVSPTLILQLPTGVNPSLYNYCYIDIYHRYYYVREMTFNDACWEIDLVVDPLASWKTNIGEYSGYILRSSNQYDETIMDMTYPAKTGISQSIVPISPLFTEEYNSGMFSVGLAGNETTYYLLTTQNFENLIDYVFSDEYLEELIGSNWATVYEEAKAQVNPIQYFTSIIWLPFGGNPGSGDSVKVGWVTTPIKGQKIDNLAYGQLDTISVNIPKHPQSSSRGNYLNFFPFSRYKLYFPPFGLIELNSAEIGSLSNFSIRTTVDLRTGEGHMITLYGNGVVGNSLFTQVGVPFQVSQVLNKGFSITTAIQEAAPLVSSLLQGNITGFVSNAASTIENGVSSWIPSVSTIGSNGSVSSLDYNPLFQAEFFNIVNEDFNHRGRPLCQVRQISTIPGFIMCADADIGIWGTVDEQQQIREYMEEGFFYE